MFRKTEKCYNIKKLIVFFTKRSYQVYTHFSNHENITEKYQTICRYHTGKSKTYVIIIQANQKYV